MGGDWFDAIPLGDGRHLKVIGDVMGHGVEVAVAMNHYRSLLRLLAEDGLPPHRVLERLDGAVERSGLDRGATCLLAVVDRRAGTCEVASAGHLPPVFIDPGPSGARVAHLQAGPRWARASADTGRRRCRVRPGRCCSCTPTAWSSAGEDIDVSVERLTRLTLPASGRLEDLLDQAVDRFGAMAEDDIAIVASRAREH